ncbi:unnamed protein product [Lactuca saligna]|uniref:Transposase MuDR plant domain-containing protein n=1 Tax=Lactuca saligna TaxID=75948 RepID=A0AA35Z9P8_LACSI|nr:unnamed protein product [Lactuca saligna]
MGHIEEVCKSNLGNLAEEPISEDIDGQQSVRLDEFEAFTDDYSTYAEFDAEYSVPNGEDNQVEMEILEGMVSDDSGDAFYSENEDGFDYSADDSDDSDYIVHESNMQFDVDVDMSEFQSHVDVDEHGILNKQTESIGNDIVDEELEVIQSDDYQYAGFNEDERTKMLKELSRSTPCSHGEIHLKPYRVGQCFKTKKEVVDYMHAHAVNTRRSLYLAKNDKIRIRVKCGGVVGQSTETVQCGGPSTRSKFHSSALAIATLSSNRFIDLIKPGITTNALAHIGGSTHLTNPHLEQFKNCLPGLRSVHEVNFVVSIPHLQIAIFDTRRNRFGIRCTVE